MSQLTILPFEVRESGIAGLSLLQLKQVTDERGTVREFYRESAFAEADGGLAALGPWVQLNVTETVQGAVRGLHGEATDKLVGVVAGEAFGAYVDTRADSPSYGKVVTVMLVPGVQVLVPAGVCNGFQSTSPGVTQYLYAYSTEWTPGMPGTALNPLDPTLQIPWPLPIDPGNPAQISAKDAAAPAWRS